MGGDTQSYKYSTNFWMKTSMQSIICISYKIKYCLLFIWLIKLLITFDSKNGALPYFDLQVHQFLNHAFPDKWIGRRGTIEWPSKSSDTNSLDYFFWGHLKNVIFVTKPRNIHELRNRILNVEWTSKDLQIF